MDLSALKKKLQKNHIKHDLCILNAGTIGNIDKANLVGGGLIDVPCGYGKCLAKDTPVLMYSGIIKKVQNIRVGEVLMGDDSTPRNVLSITSNKETMYRIIDKYGESYECFCNYTLSLNQYI